MDFHPFVSDADTIFERFDENAVFKEWRRPKNPFSGISETLFLEVLMHR